MDRPDVTYPIRETRAVGADAIVFTFSTSVYHGSEDRTEEGMFLSEIVDKNGVAHPRPEWRDIPGITWDIERVSEGRGIYAQTVTVTVSHEACPVLLHANDLFLYESEDHVEHDLKPYAILVTDAGDRPIPSP
jgi:hypothetical protein